MREKRNRRLMCKDWFILAIAVSILLGGSLACGMGGRAMPYTTSAPYISQHYCTATPTPEQHRMQKTLTTVVGNDICLLNASDGTLHSHIRLNQFYGVTGYAHGLLYFMHNLPQANNSSSVTQELCAASIVNGKQRWCQSQVTKRIGSPTLSAHGVVYFKAEDSQGLSVMALSEANGHVLWNYPAHGSTPGLLALHDNVLYTDTYQDTNSSTNDSSTAIYRLCALRASTGKELWCFKSPEGAVDNVTVDGLVYVRTSTSAEKYTTPGNTAVYALSPATGSVVWKKSLGLSQTSEYHPLIVASHGLVYVNIMQCHCAASDTSDDLIALRVSDGSQAWSQTISAPIWTFATTNTTLYVGASAGEGVLALRPGDGSLIWQHKITDPDPSSSLVENIVYTIVVDNQAIYVLGFYPYSTITALDKRTGKARWQDGGCSHWSVTTTITATPSSLTPLSPGVCYWGGIRANDDLLAVAPQGQMLLPLS